MNDEAESSRAQAARHGQNQHDDDEEDDLNHERTPHDLGDDGNDDDDDDAEYYVQIRKERRLDAKRKRIVFLEQLLRELDGLVFLELITLYYLDCSFFWFVIRAIIHGSLLTPLPEMGLTRQNDEHKPYLPMILFTFAVNFLLHLLYAAPSAGEETRGYLHGGLMIDFIGEQGPTSKWKLAFLDIAILLLEMLMLAVHVKRRELKKNLSLISAGENTTDAAPQISPAAPTTSTPAATTTPTPASAVNASTTTEALSRPQDADAEERGVLRRTDTLSDMEADADPNEHVDEEDILLPSSESRHVDALDMLTSGQCVVADFTLIDTLLQAHVDYNVYRKTRAESSSSSSSSSAPGTAGSAVPSNTLRQIQAIRARMGVGGGM
ncbi:unnamed protein product [Periconia digitata]|uniref:DUF1746 domain-containing protein n=1 Tax=Periconia digitata TaxID=1303443 RepID=A0A9W4XLM5_9PLEO|nr:unnamed protein product [Periconia digitata]